MMMILEGNRNNIVMLVFKSSNIKLMEYAGIGTLKPLDNAILQSQPANLFLESYP